MTPDPSPALDPPVQAMLADRIGYLLAKLHLRWLQESVAVLREADLGLSAIHFGALSVIESAGPLSQQELGEHVRKDRTSIVAIIDELEGAELVERHRNQTDRRAYALELTEAGRDWLARARPVMTAAEVRLLNPLDEAERVALLGMLQRVFFDG